MRGATWTRLWWICKPLYFNPRTPCGVRLQSVFPYLFHFYFNPRTPCGVRLVHNQVMMDSHRFQSTHPVRGATGAGEDARPAGAGFQSTHPVRGATGHVLGFQQIVHGISIHAPRAGCDGAGGVIPGKQGNFNPRTPCGVRPSRCISFCGWVEFQSTHPVRGATSCVSILLSIFFLFQSTHPVRGATVYALGQWGITGISIHAPRAGCDDNAGPGSDLTSNFNPRTPCGVRLQPVE